MTDSTKIVALVLCLAVSLPLSAARRRAVAPPARALSIEFVDVPAAGANLVAAGSDAWIDLKTVSQQVGLTAKPIRVRQRFGIRIKGTGVSWGTAMVTARLDSPDGRALLRIDGKPLSSVPLVIDARAVVGALTIHTLEIEVPDSAAEGPLAVSISWDATTQ